MSKVDKLLQRGYGINRVFYDKDVHSTVSQLSEITGVPEIDIIPVINSVTQGVNVVHRDILALNSLDRLLTTSTDMMKCREPRRPGNND